MRRGRFLLLVCIRGVCDRDDRQPAYQRRVKPTNDGRWAVLSAFSPYHLCSVEVPLTVAQAVFYHESSAYPLKKLVSECITVAKKDLHAGEVLDGIGEYCYRGSIDHAEIARREHLLPLGLAKGCVLKTDVPKEHGNHLRYG